MNYNNTDNLVIQETYDQLDRLYLKNYYLPAKRDTINGTVQRIPKKLIYQDLYDYKVGGNGVQTVDVKRVFIPELSKPKLVTNSGTAGCITVSMSIIYKSKITLNYLAKGWGFMWSQSNAADLFNKLSQNDLSTSIIDNINSNNLISLIQGENSLQICGLSESSNIWIRGYVQVETGRIWSPPAQFVV
jgi:hypothetical protein